MRRSRLRIDNVEGRYVRVERTQGEWIELPFFPVV